jgi:hypothetical protein
MFPYCSRIRASEFRNHFADGMAPTLGRFTGRLILLPTWTVSALVRSENALRHRQSKRLALPAGIPSDTAPGSKR